MDIYQAIRLFVVVCIGIALLLIGGSIAVSAILDDDTPNAKVSGAEWTENE